MIGLFSTPVCTIRLLELANQSADFQLWISMRLGMGDVACCDGFGGLDYVA